MAPGFNSQDFDAARLLLDTATAQLGVVAVEQPQFWNERGFDFAPMEYSNHTALRDDNRDRAQPL
jgi:hypothetical protein